MKHQFNSRYLRLAQATVLGAVLAFSGPAVQAVEVGGIKLDDSVKLADKDLKLNGAGIRTKVVFKVYAAGLYLTEKKSTTADVLALAGPRRVAPHGCHWHAFLRLTNRRTWSAPCHKNRVDQPG